MPQRELVMSHDLPPTIELTERASRTCGLAAADVDFLVAGHRAHVAVAPTSEAGCFRLTPRGHVGTIAAPGCRLVIRPKIPLENLFHLLDPTAPLPVTEDHTAVAPGRELLDFLAARLARLMSERAAVGLHREYVEHATAGPFLQGRLDMPAQLRASHGGRDKVHCRSEDFTLDVPCNQLPRATAELVLRSPLLGEEVRCSLAQAQRAFAGVGAVDLRPDTFAAVGRVADAYGPLLDLCRLLAEGLTPSAASGPVACPAFLLDMERIFETYCTRALAAAFAGIASCQADVQPLFRASRSAEGGPDLWMRPDFTLRRDGRPWVVVDAKWKRAPEARADLYQVLGYCAALGFPRGVLVYPGGRDRAWTYRFAKGRLQLTVCSLRVVGARAACGRSLARLVRKIRGGDFTSRA
jgi:5-methylcytosine-specific restriction enzyme subunit McrC